jgi:hypothetical protein
MIQRLLQITGIIVNVAELVVGHGQVVDRIRRQERQGLLVVVGGGVDMVLEFILRFVRFPGIIEAGVGNVTKSDYAFATSQSIALGAQFQAAATPALGFVQVTQGRQVFVGVSEVEGGDCSTGRVTYFQILANRQFQK